MAQRPLTLTEELEKLEQSITLTLQEIDHNFSQAHRIVTTSILPLVEQYADHSRDVWQGAKFWKQFFEASANVSLSGYEEHPNEEDTTQEPTMTEDESSENITQSNLSESASYDTPSSARLDINHRADDLELTALSLSSHSTPRAQLDERHTHDDDGGHYRDDTTLTSSIAHPSPYGSFKREVHGGHHRPESPQYDDDSHLPSTPGRYSRPRGYSHDDLSTTPMSSSPFVPPVSHEAPPSTTGKRGHHHKTSDPVMHHMLDKTYRVQATPIGKGYGTAGRSKFTVTPKSSKYADDSPMSSPEPEAPKLRAEFFSPVKGTETPGRNRQRRTSSHLRITPKPGMSVLTPAKGDPHRKVWDSDDEFEEDETIGPSPPKTMQFHIPQSRLMKTPAKEASKRIVEHLLYTAGANDTTDDIQFDHSPSLVRRAEQMEDDTF
ncbi:DASH complex subunit ask1 [Aspergillus nanangensis]|uniref:DASH complex subunit ASK1 n=1 Tax=Aspergillus nanangensis TaxID=2582783 RepID=A0AAD4GMY1_ASPNN|nr:DASH complex subunit ask1 [Aspergillus nanangensis]